MNLVVLSHLRWDFVWQRPQHILSRLGKQGRVIFVEEPIAVPDAPAPRLDVRHEPNNVTVVRLIYPTEARWIGHGDSLTAAVYEAKLKAYLADEGVSHPVAWLYTPVALHLADAIGYSALVYDVMDELSAFKGASAQLRYFDALALSSADVVFTGGLSLYQARKEKNANVHLFASGVEIEHFAPAAHRASFVRPDDMAHISSPVLGYYGVIDERIDLDLLARSAAARPDWQFVMLGPTAKLDPRDLPAAPNMHYLGMKTYQQLPAYLAHFDVALVPFALNEATRYVSPTKTLEYMAAHKPIVSTPIHDIVAQYSHIVGIARNCDEFVRAVTAALTNDPMARRAVEQQILNQHTWDGIAARMASLIAGVMKQTRIATQQKKVTYVRPGA